MEQKRLYKSSTNRVLCGVCGGIGEYFNIDPTIIRFNICIICIWSRKRTSGIYCCGDHHAGAEMLKQMIRNGIYTDGRILPFGNETICLKRLQKPG